MTRGPLKWALPALVLAAVAGVALLLRALAAFDPAYNPHAHFRTPGMCPRCHLGPADAPITDRFSPDSTDYCFTCHSPESLGRSHPNRVRPQDRYWKMRVPAEYRLDDDGRIMCLTCHNAHGPFVATVKTRPVQAPENPDAAPGTPLYYRTWFLRRSDPERGWAVLCDGCHERL